MFARFFRSLIALAIVVVVYNVYAWVVVPRLTPGAVVRTDQTSPFTQPLVNPVAKYQQHVLAAYFPADHWSLTGKPKIVENGNLMFVLDDYRRDDNGRVDLTQFALILFPTRRTTAAPAPGDAVIVEADHGAKLKFDGEYNPAQFKIGKIERGVLEGRVTIRSGMREAGPHDDLLIEARDLSMNQSVITTNSKVNFRLGPNRGSGREMIIVLLPEEHPGASESGFGIRGVRELEIFRDVSLSLHVGDTKLSDTLAASRAGAPMQRIQLTSHRAEENSGASAWAGGGRAESVYQPPRVAQQPRAKQPAGRPAPPLVVECAGSLRFNFLDLTATFDRDVLATQLSLTGQSDQMFCHDNLVVKFSTDGPNTTPQDDPDFAENQRSALGKLRPTMLLATGKPVRIDSPSREASAGASRVRVDLDRRRLSLEGGSPYLEQGKNKVTAPIIRYEHPAKGEPAAIGRMWIAGPGVLRATPDPAKPQDFIQAEWNAVPDVPFPVQLLRENDRPVLSVEGRPRILSSRLGQIVSDRLRLSMREVEADGKQGPAIEVDRSENRLALLPERIDAIGAVLVQSPELTANTHRLSVWVRPEPPAPDMGNPHGSGDLRSRNDRRAPQETYTLNSQQMQMDLLLRGRSGTPANLICEGGVTFSEDAKPDATKTPLKVTGDWLKVSDLKSGSIQVEVKGVRPQGNRSPNAEIVAQGMTLRSAAVHLNQATNLLRADGAGHADITTNRDLLGQATRAATNLHLRWKDGLTFDGRRIIVKGQVVGDGPHDWVRCEQATATLVRPINFTDARDTGDVEIAQLDCTGGVTIDHRTVDEQGQSAHERGKLETLSVNLVSGEISGQGPGRIRSVRLMPAGGFSALGADDKPAGGSKPGLQFLSVSFVQGIAGSLKQRELNFLGNVQAVTGLVAAWEREIPLMQPGGLAPDTATLNCDRLKVNEDPLVGLSPGSPDFNKKKLGPVELHAIGNVKLQGAVEGKGVFTAYASRASYIKSKEMVSMQGNERSKVVLYQQGAPGQQPSKAAYQSLDYWPKTGAMKINGVSGATVGPSSAVRPGASVPRR